MLLNISGLSSSIGLRLLDSTKTQQLDQLKNEPQSKRAVEAFLSGIASIETPKELVDNYEVYSFIMRAFDLEDQIFGRGMMRKVLEADPSDDTSLVNRLTDPRFRKLHDALGFVTDEGPTTPDFSDPTWQQAIVSRFFEQVLENSVSEQNATVGTVMAFRRQLSELDSWFDVLKNKELSQFFRTALSLPDQIATLDPDRQKAIFEQKIDLGTLSDERVQNRLIARYTALSDVVNPQANVSSAAVSILKQPTGLGVIVSLSVPPVPFSATALYR